MRVPFCALLWTLAIVHGSHSPIDAPASLQLCKGDCSPAGLPRDGPLLETQRKKKKECPDVRNQKDQCAFVQKYCADAAIGYFDYLQFYYCSMRSVKPLGFTILISWLVLLFTTIGIAASDFFCPNLSTIAQKLGMSESMAGVTFLAFGNGSPDVFSTFAAMKAGSGSLAVGELIGAASFISAVVAGSMALVRPFKVSRHSFLRDGSLFALAVLFSLVFLSDGKIYTWECILMICFYVFYVFVVVCLHWWTARTKKRRNLEIIARNRYSPVGEEDRLEQGEERLAGDRTHLRVATDIEALNMSNDEDDESDDEQMEHEYAGLNRDMRISRAASVSANGKSPTLPIRPSLFGAIEFQSIIHSLDENRNLRPNKFAKLRRHTEAASTKPQAASEHDNLDPQALYRDRGRSEEPSASRYRSISVNDSSLPSIQGRSFDPVAEDSAKGSHLRSKSSTDLIQLPVPRFFDAGYNVDNHPALQTPQIQIISPPRPSSLPHLVVTDADGNAPSHSPPFSPKQIAESPILSPKHSPSVPRSFSNSSQSGLSVPALALSAPEQESLQKLPRYYPKFLPPPAQLLAVLFPTLSRFGQKSLLQKAVSIIAVPSVLLLTLTLPVVDPAAEEGVDVVKPPVTPDGIGPPAIQVTAEHRFEEGKESIANPKAWNRWLVQVQCILAPTTVTCLAFSDEPLLFPFLYACIGSLAALACIILFTRPERPPNWKLLFCFAGFAVSISWISTVANEVVGVLKAIGSIMGISDAILGLTVFAVGNSLGDLVANVTVAKMGYPMMALSACFGGPMLNILLGIGISGLYMNVSHGDDAYVLKVSPTLVLSALTLLVALLFLLIAVPLRNFVMTKSVGWSLIALWIGGTAINLILELSGIEGKHAND